MKTTIITFLAGLSLLFASSGIAAQIQTPSVVVQKKEAIAVATSSKNIPQAVPQAMQAVPQAMQAVPQAMPAVPQAIHKNL